MQLESAGIMENPYIATCPSALRRNMKRIVRR